MFCTKKLASVWKAADLNLLVQGGQPHWSFPFSKASLDKPTTYFDAASATKRCSNIPQFSSDIDKKVIAKMTSVLWKSIQNIWDFTGLMLKTSYNNLGILKLLQNKAN